MAQFKNGAVIALCAGISLTFSWFRELGRFFFTRASDDARRFHTVSEGKRDMSKSVYRLSKSPKGSVGTVFKLQSGASGRDVVSVRSSTYNSGRVAASKVIRDRKINGKNVH